MEIEYGVRFDTHQPTLTDYALGVVAGVGQWTTGRPARDGWKEGVLSKGSFSPVSQEIDIARGGSYATMSGFKVGTRAILDDGDPVWKRVRDLGLNLIQADIEFWCWRDGVATVDWTGKVMDTEAEMDAFGITAMDAFRAIHKTVAGTKVDADAFPDAPADSIGDPIPATFGYVRHAKILNISSRAEAIECATMGSTNYKVLAASAYNPSTAEVTLKTGRMVFSENDANLVGSYLCVIKGGLEKQGRKIISNTASSGTGADTGVTIVTLADSLAVDDPGVIDTGNADSILWSSGHYPSVVWFEINAFGASLLVSEKAIRSLEVNAQGRTLLEYFEAERKNFVDISEALETGSLTDVGGFGYPGATIVSKRVDAEGNMSVLFNIAPSSIEFVSFTDDGDWSSGPTQDASANKDNLVDGARASVVTATANVTSTDPTPPPANARMTAIYDLRFSEEVLAEAFSGLTNLYALSDMSIDAIQGSDTGQAYQIEATIQLFTVDIYGSVSPAIGTREIYDSGDKGFGDDVDEDVNTLPNSYFGLEGNNSNFYAAKADLDVQSCIEDFKSSIAYPKIRVRLDLVLTMTNFESDIDVTWLIREIGLVGVKGLNVISDDLFMKAQGEVYQSTWGGRKTAGDLPAGVVDVLEHIIREYDGASEFIDTDAFDEAHVGASREQWLCGRQVEDTESFEIAKDLARFGFFGIIPKRNGTRAPICWLDAGAAAATHNSSIIDAGSISGRTLTSLADVFNEPQVNYDWNPAAKKFKKFLRITRIDEDEFPAAADAEWKTYAIGFPDALYSVAKECWDRCHLSYLRYGFIRPLPQEMQDCYWGPDIADWGGDFANSIAYRYMVALSAWTPFRKDVVNYTLPNTATHAARELLDKITFNDAEATAGVNEDGWIVKRSIVPGTGEDGKDYIEISLMLEPDTGD